MNRYKSSISIVLLSCIVLIVTETNAQWSTNFANGGMNNVVYSLALKGTDLYIGGDFSTAGGTAVEDIAKFDVNSNSWVDYGDFSGSSWYVDKIAINSSDTIYAGGFFFISTPEKCMVKWRNGGNWGALSAGIDHTLDFFGPAVYAMAVNSSDELYVGGYFNWAEGLAASYIAKWDGSNWSLLGSGVDYIVRTITINGSDVYVGGQFTIAGGTTINRIAKWDGSNWTGLGGGMNNTVRAIAISGTDLYAGGDFTTADTGTASISANYIAKWDMNTNTWSAVGGGTNGTVNAIAITGNDVYVGGTFTQVGGSISANNIAQWDANASSWSALGAGTDNTVRTIVINIGGDSIYVGGNFQNAGSNPNGRVARYTPFPLPIELLSFDATLLSDNTVAIKWTTETEINNDNFIIQKTVDAVNYEFVAKVDGAGNSSTTLNYATIDKKPYTGISYYRLKQIDYDGKFTYSEITTVNMQQESSGFFRLYPNPAVDELTVKLYSEKKTDLIVKIFNKTGEKVMHNNLSVEKGTNQLPLNIRALHTGYYMIEIISESGMYLPNHQAGKTQKQPVCPTYRFRFIKY